jgi:hypothetical protein
MTFIYNTNDTIENNVSHKIHVSIYGKKVIHFVNKSIDISIYIKSIFNRHNCDIEYGYYTFLDDIKIKTLDNTLVNLTDNISVGDVKEIIILNKNIMIECPVCLELCAKWIKPYNCKHELCNPCWEQILNTPLCCKRCPICRCNKRIMFM